MSFPNVGQLTTLEFGPFFGENRAIDRTDLKTDAAVDASVEVDPEKIGALLVFALARLDASHWTGIDTIGNSFADIRNDGVSHNSDLIRAILVTYPFEGLASRQLQSAFSFISVVAWPVIETTDLARSMQCRLMLQCLFQGLLTAEANQCR